jgi:hypothetical protein
MHACSDLFFVPVPLGTYSAHEKTLEKHPSTQRRQTHTHTHSCTRVCVRVCVCVHAHKHAHTHTHTDEESRNALAFCPEGRPFRQGLTPPRHQHCSNKVTEQVIQEPAPIDILMVTLWVLIVKCKLEESLKK